MTWKGKQRLKGGQRSGTFHPILAWILTPSVEEEHVKSLEENHARYLQEQQESFDQKMIVEDLLAYSQGDLFTKKVVFLRRFADSHHRPLEWPEWHEARVV